MNLEKFPSSEEYLNADPFPHAVLDGVFDDEFLRRVSSDFPGPESTDWLVYNNEDLQRHFLDNPRKMASSINFLLSHLMGPEFTGSLRRMTGISNLLPSLEDAGIHLTPNGCRTNIHLDFNLRFLMNRKVTLLLYLNEAWEESWGGAFELWNESRCVKRVSPVFNRMVVFSNSEKSLHGNPQTISAPKNVYRKNALVHYFTETPLEPGVKIRDYTFLRP